MCLLEGTGMAELLLTDLIDVELLQKIQDEFSKYTGMAALTTDADGNPLTEGRDLLRTITT